MCYHSLLTYMLAANYAKHCSILQIIDISAALQNSVAFTRILQHSMKFHAPRKIVGPIRHLTFTYKKSPSVGTSVFSSYPERLVALSWDVSSVHHRHHLQIHDNEPRKLSNITQPLKWRPPIHVTTQFGN